MARRNKTKQTKKPTDLSEFYLIVFGGFLILVFLIFFFIHRSNTAVQGIQDFRTPTSATGSWKTCAPGRVISFSVEKTCDNGDKDGFSVSRYTCGNGLTGVLTKGCMNPSQAFAYAKLACSKTVCATPLGTPITTLGPKPTSTAHSSFSPLPHASGSTNGQTQTSGRR